MKKLILLITIFSLNACEFLSRNTVGLFDGDTPPLATTQANVETKEASRFSSTATSGPTDKIPAPSDVAIVWKIPQDPVDGFVVHYGYNKDLLSNEIRVKCDALEKFEDPANGFVYRYYLKSLPENKVIFVSLSSFKGDAVSRPSSVWAVSPMNKR